MFGEIDVTNLWGDDESRLDYRSPYGRVTLHGQITSYCCGVCEVTLSDVRASRGHSQKKLFGALAEDLREFLSNHKDGDDFDHGEDFLVRTLVATDTQTRIRTGKMCVDGGWDVLLHTRNPKTGNLITMYSLTVG